MKQKTRFKNFGNVGYWYWLLVHEWLIYRYWPKKRYICQSLVSTLSKTM